MLSRPGSVPGFTLASASQETQQGAPAQTWNCPNGGTVRVFAPVALEDRTVQSLDAADCGFGAVRVSGDFEGATNRVIPDYPAQNQLWEVAGYLFRDARPGGVVVETDGDTSVAAAFPDGANPEYDWFANNYRVTTPTGSYGRGGEVAVFQSRTPTFEPDAPPGLSVSLQMPRGSEAQARARTLFRRPTDGAPGYRTGELSISGPFTRENGFEYRYVLRSDNGDPASFQLDVTEGGTRDGTTTSYTVPWSSRFDFGTFDPSSVDFGL